jgi:hypothetical protein
MITSIFMFPILLLYISGAPRVRVPAGAGKFLFATASRPEIRRPEREADHSPPFSVNTVNAWKYISTPQYVFMEWCLVKHRDNFTFTF